MKEFEKGARIRTASGGELEIVRKLGAGGQGAVYEVNYNGRPMALKWYFPNKMKNPKSFYQNIRDNIRHGAPTKAFLWPQEVTEWQDASFGYLMELRPPQYQEFSRFLLNRERFASMEAMMNAALCIIRGFRVLHNAGYSYQDLNDGNFFVDPKTGDVLICDNDNVAPYGENLGIGGKMRYMAPEVVMRKKSPDLHTDRFSLAVVLYLLLFRNHPLEGKKTMCPCLTEELEQKFYGSEPVFVWDPQDNSNRPVRGVHVNEIMLWPVYPQYVREVFEKAFSRDAMTGSNTAHRVTEKKWQEIFTTLRDSLVQCGCGEETFIDTQSPACSCINCGRVLQRPLILKVKRYRVALVPHKKVYGCHIVHDSDDFREMKGEVVSSKNHPSVQGLKNESGFPWTVTLPGGSARTFDNGQVVRLARGLTFNFGNGNTGEIQ